ncbi:MAG: tRNA pseudouridine(38-40) synthase TruA [Planctomycetia bacterium]|nr:tRNA pseudouridine(38-40) synthase TruA [Planctomycetia bacterium]
MHNCLAMRNIRITIAYDGTNYHGWQRQPRVPTVQAEVEAALARTLRCKPSLSAASRTDAGVHSMGQVANFRTDAAIDDERLLMALNSRLPDDIAVTDLREVPDEFDASVSAERKWYRYRLWHSRIKPVFDAKRLWHWYRPLEVGPMLEAARFLTGRHDFKSFEGRGSNRPNTVRTIFRLDILREPPEPDADGTATLASGTEVVFDVDGDGFLYRMVRNIVGTLIEVGRGHWSPQCAAEALEAKDRTKAGPTAPAHGLCLMRVWYPSRFA